jgi:hypothetical protein
MPVLEFSVGSLISGFFGGMLTQLAKSAIDYLWNSDFFIRRSVSTNMDWGNVNLINDNNNVLVDSADLICQIKRKMLGNTYGVLVFAAPQGSGKSTSVNVAAASISANRSIKLKLIKNGSTVLTNQDLNSHLKIPTGRALSDFLPANSVIILDQIDFSSPLSESLCNYITDLATDSHNSKIYKIVLCVSNSNVAKQILNCNGREKIQLLCPYISLAWTDTQLRSFIQYKLPQLPTDEYDKLTKLARKCKNSPGLINKAYGASNTYDNVSTVSMTTYVINNSSKICEVIPANEWINLEDYATQSEFSWMEFNKAAEARNCLDDNSSNAINTISNEKNYSDGNDNKLPVS